MNPTLSDLQILLSKAKHQYAMAIVATNDAANDFRQRQHRIASTDLRSIVVTAESLVKIGRAQAAYDFLKGKA